MFFFVFASSSINFSINFQIYSLCYSHSLSSIFFYFSYWVIPLFVVLISIPFLWLFALVHLLYTFLLIFRSIFSIISILSPLLCLFSTTFSYSLISLFIVSISICSLWLFYFIYKLFYSFSDQYSLYFYLFCLYPPSSFIFHPFTNLLFSISLYSGLSPYRFTLIGSLISLYSPLNIPIRALFCSSSFPSSIFIRIPASPTPHPLISYSP